MRIAASISARRRSRLTSGRTSWIVGSGISGSGAGSIGRAVGSRLTRVEAQRGARTAASGGSASEPKARPERARRAMARSVGRGGSSPGARLRGQRPARRGRAAASPRAAARRCAAPRPAAWRARSTPRAAPASPRSAHTRAVVRAGALDPVDAVVQVRADDRGVVSGAAARQSASSSSGKQRHAGRAPRPCRLAPANSGAGSARSAAARSARVRRSSSSARRTWRRFEHAVRPVRAIERDDARAMPRSRSGRAMRPDFTRKLLERLVAWPGQDVGDVARAAARRAPAEREPPAGPAGRAARAAASRVDLPPEASCP